MAKMTLQQAAKALGIPVTATMQELKHAYKTLAQKCHPDKVPESEQARAHELWVKIQEAYEVFKKYLEPGNTTMGNGQQSSGAEQNRPGSGTSSNGHANRPGGNTSNKDPHTDPIVKMFWQEYQRACKNHEKFVNTELAQSCAKIDTAENALKQTFGQRNEKELKAAATLAYLVQQHQLLIGRVNILFKIKDQCLKNYNDAVARFNQQNKQGAR